MMLLVTRVPVAALVQIRANANDLAFAGQFAIAERAAGFTNFERRFHVLVIYGFWFMQWLSEIPWTSCVGCAAVDSAI